MAHRDSSEVMCFMKRSVHNQAEIELLHLQGHDTFNEEHVLHDAASSFCFNMIRTIDGMRMIFTRACLLLNEGKVEGAFTLFGELHRRAGDVHVLAMHYGYTLGMAAIVSLRCVLESMVDPAKASLDAVSGHLDILDKIFRDDIRSDEDARSKETLIMMKTLRLSSANASRRASAELHAARINGSS